MVEVSSWKVCVFVVVVAVAVHFVYQRLYTLPLKMDGYSDTNFRDVAQTFRHLIQAGEEQGGAFVVYFRGRKVVDMLGGYADREAELPWTHDTVTQLFSLSAVAPVFSLLLLSERTNFSLSDTVRQHWPEFALEDLTVEQLLQQRHALFRLPEAVSIRDLADDPARLDSLLRLAVQQPHAGLDTKFLAQGLYLDALLRRADPGRRSAGQSFHDDVAFPLSLDAHLGLPRTQVARAARVRLPAAGGLWAALRNLDFAHAWTALGWNRWWRLATEGVFSDFELRWAMRPDAMEVAHPSLSLFSNARSLGRLMAVVAGGGRIDGRQALPLSAARLRALAEVAARGYDRVLGGPVAYNAAGMEVQESPKGSNMVGFYGLGGQLAFADMDHELAFAYTTNHLHACSRGRDPIAGALIRSIYDCLAKVTRAEAA